jgi:hypothetical protein
VEIKRDWALLGELKNNVLNRIENPYTFSWFYERLFSITETLFHSIYVAPLSLAEHCKPSPVSYRGPS